MSISYAILNKDVICYIDKKRLALSETKAETELRNKHDKTNFPNYDHY